MLSDDEGDGPSSSLLCSTCLDPGTGHGCHLCRRPVHGVLRGCSVLVDANEPDGDVVCQSCVASRPVQTIPSEVSPLQASNCMRDEAIDPDGVRGWCCDCPECQPSNTIEIKKSSVCDGMGAWATGQKIVKGQKFLNMPGVFSIIRAGSDPETLEQVGCTKLLRGRHTQGYLHPQSGCWAWHLNSNWRCLCCYMHNC